MNTDSPGFPGPAWNPDTAQPGEYDEPQPPAGYQPILICFQNRKIRFFYPGSGNLHGSHIMEELLRLPGLAVN